MNTLFVAFGQGIVVTALAILILKPLAPILGLVDQPNSRKQHTGRIPLIGGPAIFLSILLGVLVFLSSGSSWVFLTAAGAIVLVGMIDDAVDIRPSLKMAAQLTIALFFIYFGDVRILQVGNLVGSGEVQLGVLSVAFTAACMLGVINSINMIDGTDGLAATIVLMTFSSMIGLAVLVDRQDDVVPLILVAGSLVGFLAFNSRLFLKKAVIFLGDSGSMLLGFVMVWFYIELTQGEAPAFSAVAAGWLFGLPLADTVSVIVSRLRQGQSPFAADRAHFHHCLLDAGVSLRATTIILLSLHAGFIMVGVLLGNINIAMPLLFWLFVFVVIIHHFITPKLITKYTANRGLSLKPERVNGHRNRS